MGKNGYTREKVEEIIRVNEKTKLSIDFNNLQDPSIYISSLIDLIIELLLIGEKKKGKEWIDKAKEMFVSLKNREVTTTPLMKIAMLYFDPFVLSFCEENPNWALLNEYSDKFQDWSDNYYKNKKMDNESIEDMFFLFIITGKEDQLLNIFSNTKIPPIADGFIQVLTTPNESNLKLLKQKVVRRIRRNELIHGDNILLLMAYYKAIGKNFDLNEYFNWLREFILE